MAGIFVPIVADASRLLRSFKQASAAADTFGRDLKQLGLTAEQSAQKQVQAATRRDARLRSEIAAYRQLASAAERGSREQITAANLATQAEGRLARSLGVTTAEAKAHARAVSGAEREVSRFGRGALAGSGLVRSLGRSLAFASGGFIAFAGLSHLIEESITAASDATATERQLGAQFRAVGQDVDEYKRQITAAALQTSKLSGFTEVDLTRAFTTAFRATKDVNTALTIMRASADAARGSHKDLQSITLGLTRAWGGAATSLRRLGILIPTTVKGMDAVAFVQRRFAGQAAAGTTAQQRFAAALHNTEVSIGSALYPTLVRVLTKGTDWLSQQRNQERIQHDVANAVKVGTAAVEGFAQGLKIAARVLAPFVALVGGARRAAELLAIVYVGLKIKALAAAVGLKASGTAAVVAGEESAVAAGQVGTLGARLKGLPTRIGIAVVVGVEFYGPAKKFFEQQFGANFKGITTGGGVDMFGARAQRQAISRARALRRAGNSNRAIVAELLRENFSVDQAQNAVNQITPTGEDVRLRGLVRGAAATTVAGPLGFKARFATLELRLAQAQLTKEQADDRRILRAEEQLLRARIRTLGTARKTLAERTQLTQQLAGLEQQVAAIDDQAATARKTAADKALAARKRELAADAKRLADQKAADEQQLRTLNQRESQLQSKIKQITQSFRGAVDSARSGIGDLFAGPVLNFSDEQRRLALGFPNSAADPRALTRDLNAQVRAATINQRNLRRLRRRGAPSQLIAELQAGGMGSATEVAALAGASRGTLRQFFRAFGARERLVQNIARAEMKAQLVTLHADRLQLARIRRQEIKVEVEIKGVSRDQAKVKVKQSAAQRRGDHPGQR